MLENIEVLYHSSIKFNLEKVIYFDPFKISKNYNDADLIFITHDHYDHFSEEDILKVKNDKTKIIVTTDLKSKSLNLGFFEENIITVIPNQEFSIDNIKVTTIPAYNLNKKFHLKENNWVGYVIEVEGIKYYIAGDTDITDENMNVKCDVAFVPVGGTYTMTYDEAAYLVNKIIPRIAIPIHYGGIVGTMEDAKKFVELLNDNIEGKILLK